MHLRERISGPALSSTFVHKNKKRPNEVFCRFSRGADKGDGNWLEIPNTCEEVMIMVMTMCTMVSSFIRNFKT